MKKNLYLKKAIPAVMAGIAFFFIGCRPKVPVTHEVVTGLSAADLRMSAEYDVEEMGDALGFVDDLERGVRELIGALKDGSHRFGGDDLPFMSIVRQQSDLVLPFKGLLRDINNVHRKGLSQA